MTAHTMPFLRVGITSITILLASSLSALSVEEFHGAFLDPAAREAAVDRALNEAIKQAIDLNKYLQKTALPPTVELPDGSEMVLVGMRDGHPDYRQLLTTKASIGTNSVAAQVAHQATGASTVIGVWDSGLAMEDHQEFMAGGRSRIVNGDGSWASNHSTAVCSIAAGAGVDPDTLGAAPAATVEGYSITDDILELTRRIAGTSADRTMIAVSNHSYGTLHGWQRMTATAWYYYGAGWNSDGTGNREDPRFGFYGPEAATVDALLYAAPYGMFVQAAGNDRNQTYGGPRTGTGTFILAKDGDYIPTPWLAETAPFDDNWDNGGYDTIIDVGNGKNVVTVGAIGDPTLDGERAPANAIMSNFSGWGPTDDGRVKPDFVARGVGLRVASLAGTTSHMSGSGTSFSAPNVAGAAAQIIDFVDQTFQTRFRASTIKGLMAHTATDLGPVGPDYQNGWGIPDVLAAVDLLTAAAANPTHYRLREGLLGTHPVVEFDVVTDGTTPLVVTLCWYDPAGVPRELALDDHTPALVNDLDVRIVGPDGVTYLPWVLDPANPAAAAATGDNNVDTIEQVVVPADAPAGTYSIVVYHKGTLTGGGQWFSMLATGQIAGVAPSQEITDVETEVDEPTGKAVVRGHGRGLQPGTKAKGRKDSQELSAEITMVSDEEFIAIFDVSEAEDGAWDIVLERICGTEYLVPQAMHLGEVNTSVEDWKMMD